MQTLFYLLLLLPSLIFAMETGRNKEKFKIYWILFLLIMTIEIVLLKKTNIIHNANKIILLQILIYSIISLLIYFTHKKGKEDYNEELDIRLLLEKGKEIIIKNFYAGIAVFSGSGFGKTSSVIYPIAVEFEKKNMSSLVFDYKLGELTGIYLDIYKNKNDKLNIFCIEDIKTTKINILDPSLYKDEGEIKEVITVLMKSLLGNAAFQGTNSYFAITATNLLVGVCIRFVFDFPKLATLPNVIAFLLSCDFSASFKIGSKIVNSRFYGLKQFLKGNIRAELQARDAIIAIDTNETMSSVVSTLFNALTKLATPKIFWALSENQIDLELNKKENVLILVNNPKEEQIQIPVITAIFNVITSRIRVRNRNPMSLMLDEAATIKLENMSKIVSTMRTFKVATVYCTQDISQGIHVYKQTGFNMILSNMATIFLGKASTPDSAKFYESYMEKIEIKKKSKTRGSGKVSTTTTFQEQAKIRYYEFVKFKKGQFAFITEDKQEKVQMKKYDIKEIPYNPQLTSEDYIIINRKYNQIINDMREFAKKNNYAFF